MTEGREAERVPRLTAQIGVEDTDSFAACRALMAMMFDLHTPSLDQRRHYTMDVVLLDLGSLKLNQATRPSTPSIMVRSSQLIAQTGADQFVVQYYRTNGLTITIDRADRQVAAGDICMIDLSRPVTIRTDGIDNLAVIVDRDLLAPLLADPFDVHGLILSRDSEAGVVVREHLDDLWTQGPDLTVAEGLALCGPTAALLAAVITASSQHRAATLAELRKSQLRSICRYIDRAIGDPDLGADTIVRAFHVTRPTLYRMFEPHGGLGRYVLRRRMTGVFRDLSDPALSQRPIAEVLRSWGFTSHTAAGRSFRAIYGMSPSRCRAQAQEEHRRSDIAGPRAFDLPAQMPDHVNTYLRSD